MLVGNRNGVSLNVKLSSFELTTSINTNSIRNDIESRFDNAAKPSATLQTESKLKLLAEQRNKSKRDYNEKSKFPVASLVQPNEDHSYLDVPSEFLAYNSNFRQHLSLFNYQAPELLSTFQDFVFPTEASDVYALTLLLWESLNKVVPYVVYSKYELQCLMASEDACLPILEPQRCRIFQDLITKGLQCDPFKRKLYLDDFMNSLRCIKMQRDLHERQVLDEKNVLYVNRRLQRVPSSEMLCKEIPHRADSSESFLGHTHNTPQNGDGKRLRRSPSLDKFLANKHNISRCADGEVKITILKNTAVSPQTPAAHNQTSCSTLSEFNQIINSQVKVNGQNVWTSTMKIPNQKCQRPVSGKASVNLFKENTDTYSDDHNDVKPQTRDHSKPANISPKSALSAEKSRFLNKLLETSNDLAEPQAISKVSPSLNNLLVATTPNDKSDTEQSRRRHNNNIIRSAPPPSYRFDIGDYELPDTPIARENKIRRNAWLSNEGLSQHEGADGDTQSKKVNNIPLMVNATSSKSPTTPNKVNVSIRIVHTKISPFHKTEASNANEASSQKTSQTKEWCFGSNRRKSAEHLEDVRPTKTLHFVGGKPTKLSYSESMLKKPVPITSESEQSKNLTSEFNTCLGINSIDNVTQDFQKIINDLEMNSRSSADPPAIKVKTKPKEICCQQSTPLISSIDTDRKENVEEKSQWTPVKDTIMHFENWLSINKTNSPYLTSTNSPRSPRNINSITTPKPSKLIVNSPALHQHLPITRSVVKQHLTNIPHHQCSRSNSTASARAQTLIKRTVCTETILTGVADYDSKGSNATTKDPPTVSRKQMTSQVTLNLRQTQRQQSFGPIDKPALPQLERTESERLSKLQQEARHSICGSELNRHTALCVPSARKYVCFNCADIIPPEQLRLRKFTLKFIFIGLYFINMCIFWQQ